MKNQFKNLIIGLCITVLVLIYAVFFHNNGRDILRVSQNLKNFDSTLIVYDLAQEGVLKYYFQPGNISFYLSTYVDEPKKKEYMVKVSGVKCDLSLGSKKKNWDKLENGGKLKITRKNRARFNAEINIPRKYTRKFDVATMHITILDNYGNSYLRDLKFVNSKYKK